MKIGGLIIMIKIALCDDDYKMLGLLEENLQNILDEFGVTCIIEKFVSPVELVASFKGTIYDLLILDIVMPEQTGIETAAQLRSGGYEGDVIFMTSNPEYALDAYDVYPLSFLPKPFNYDKFVEVIKKFLSKNPSASSIVIKNNLGAKEQVSLDDILYVESQGHSVCYALINGSVYTVAGNFTKTISFLPEYFFRCHRCYAVNMKKVRTIQRYYFVLENDVQVPISKGEFKEAQKRFVFNS